MDLQQNGLQDLTSETREKEEDMGCGSSKDVKVPVGAAVKKSDQGAKGSAVGSASGSLLDKYSLGKVLGQGAFGLVYKCRKKSNGEEYAVKMIDQVETPLVEIKREADMLKRLEHPTCIKLHDVFYEKVFVCMVLEFYRGGDMIQGMMVHWKSKGMIPMSNVKNLSKQMHEACAWLHSQRCVHRDVKGDNFMMEKPNVENPQQRLYLSDFGTVREIAPNERITQKCGTRNYWPPEFYRLNYGIKVDCWAVGVVMFGLVSGKFPFKNEEDVKFKVLDIPRRCPDEGKELVRALLERDENKRIDCTTALEHQFLQETQVGTISQEVGKLDTDFTPDIKESGANAGVAQRRFELVDRLQQAEDGNAKRHVCETGDSNGFTVTDHTERAVVFEWQPSAKVKEMVATFANATPIAASDMINREVTEESVRQLLADHNVNVNGFGKGKAKRFGQFVSEIQQGSCRLMLDASQHKFLVRVVDVVLLRISYGSGAHRRILLETTPELKAHSLPGNLQAPVENALQTAQRLRTDMLCMNGCKIHWCSSTVEGFEEVMDVEQYPGIRTVFRKRIIYGEVATSDQMTLQKLGIPLSFTFTCKDKKDLNRSFEWVEERECLRRGIRITAKKQDQDFSTLVYPPIGLEADELNEFLSKNNIDTSKWGRGTFKTVTNFSEELVKGESTLIKQANGRVARVVDIVVLNLTRQETDDVLVEAEERYKDSVQHLNRLPAVKRRSDEHQFHTARRMVTKYLQLSHNRVNIDPTDVKVIDEEQESKAYHGVSTIYRKRYMKGVLLTEVAEKDKE